MTFHRPIYTGSARFDERQAALTEDELRTLVPSVFAITAHESRSDRFRPIATIDAINALAKEGFSVVGAKQAVTRVEGKAPFTKHLLRLRRVDDTKHRVGDVIPEMLLKNANDGTCAYELMAGLFRIRCLNSMVAQVSTLDSTKVRHSGGAERVIGSVIEGTYRVIDAATAALAAPADWSTVTLAPEERMLLADAAHIARFGEAENDAAAHPVRAAALLEPRRSDDAGRDLWTTFNVLQENTMRGGLHYMRDDANGSRRHMRTRPVKGIDQGTNLNRALWMITEHFAQQRKAA